MDIERAVVCKIIDAADINPVFNARINVTYFKDPDQATAFTWVLAYWDRYSAVPTKDALLREFPEYDFICPDEPFDYLLDQLRHEYRYLKVTDTLNSAIDIMRAFDPDGALRFMMTAAEQMYVDSPEFTDENLCATGRQRLENYRNIKQGMLGIPTGFSVIDRATMGFRSEQLITLTGLPKAYKSIMLLHMAITAHEAGYHPLFVGFEMTNSEQTSRHDAFRAGIGHRRLTSGALTNQEKVKLDRTVKDLEDMRPFTLVHDPASTTTVATLAAKVSQVKPDILFVDGTYLMQCDDPKLDAYTPQGLTSITRAMKRLAQRAKLPIVQTTQSLPSKYNRARGLEMGTIGYTSSFAQDSDVIIGVETYPPPSKECKVRIVAARSAPLRSMKLTIDWDRGSIKEEEIDLEAEEEDEEDRENP